MSRLQRNIETVTGRVFGRWSPSGLNTNSITSVSKENFELLSSYNWLPHETGTSGDIIVPGLPPQWDPPELPKRISPDRGLVIINQNAYRHPKCPLEPLLQALLTIEPSFDLNKVHIIGDRNNLRNLFDFVCEDAKENFVIALEMVKNTALLTRLEAANSEIIDPDVKFRGFGHEFEKACTDIPETVAGTTGHHRIVRYTFGGLNMLIRFEADAALAVPARAVSSQFLSQIDTAPVANIDDPGIGSARLKVRRAGELIPQEGIIEIKSRVQRRPITVEECMPQLWFSNTRHLYIGYHHGGIFVDGIGITVDDAAVARWELRHLQHLRNLVNLLGQILEIARENKHQRMRIKCVDGILSLEEWIGTPQDPIERLPEDLREMWSKGT